MGTGVAENSFLAVFCHIWVQSLCGNWGKFEGKKVVFSKHVPFLEAISQAVSGKTGHIPDP